VSDALRRNPLVAALGVLCALLAAVVALELFSEGRPVGSGPARKAAVAQADLLPPLSAVAPEQLYPEAVNRPLWIPTRRPAPPAAAAPASFARGQFILQGVTIAGNVRIAMLKEKASGRIHRVEKGRDFNGIQLVEVEPEKVTLAQGAEREVLELLVQRPGAAPAAGPVPVAGAAAGPFAPAVAARVAPRTPPSPSPFGQPLIPPAASAGPRPAGAASPAPSPAAANPAARAAQQPTAAPLTPEELLARRRARRNQSP